MIAPMLATLAEAPLVDAALVYEPKYDGIRAIAEVPAGGHGVHLWSRLGNEKTAQFPEVAESLGRWARRRREAVVLDGEIVALDSNGNPIGFQNLQGRLHVKEEHVERGHTAFILFDLLKAGNRDLRGQPLGERRRALETLVATMKDPRLRISEQVAGDGRQLYQRALESGWEGLIAKHAGSKYLSGKRSPDWRKLKILCEQEFVIAGWTEPRSTRAYFGALLLGVYEDDRLVYAGHTGTGFDGKELARVMARLKPLEIAQSPFAVKPKSNEKAHWVRPELVAQVKFTEWTADNHLRHPVYLGLRDDKRPRDVVHERSARHHPTAKSRLDGAGSRAKRDTADADEPKRSRAGAKRRTATSASPDVPDTANVIDQLRELEDAGRDGILDLPDGGTLAVTNLRKVFWPALALTKGDLFRYYAQVAPYILPALNDRPLVMKRYPNGIAAKPFYQHRATGVPAHVRVDVVPSVDDRPQLIGGDLTTLLYTCQLAAISQDPWFSRVQSPGYADQVALDLDPPDDVPFARVLDVARWIRDELETLGVFALPKTSGSRGLHIYIPLRAGTPYESGLLFCQLVATLVAEKHPRVTTVERAVRARGARVYVDYLQNIEGKTLASAYSVRANEHAGVSTPLTWAEVDRGVRREDFTMLTVPDRLKRVGDLWEPLRRNPGADLRAISGT
jgi:bifunctional non-homologous end joining protein LigD